MRRVILIACVILAAWCCCSTAESAPGDICETAISYGTIPPDASESGIVVPSGGVTWRSFSLTGPRAVRILWTSATTNAFSSLIQECFDSDGWRDVTVPAAYFIQMNKPLTVCLEPGQYPLRLLGESGGTFDVQITDQGPCTPPPRVSVLADRVRDVNGDGDGFPDTGETVDVTLRVENKSHYDFTNVRLTPTLLDAAQGCLATAAVTLPLVPAQGAATASVPVRFTVGSTVDRAAAGVTPSQAFAATMRVAVTADQFAVPVAQDVPLELDLNSTTATGPTTTFADGFEQGFVNFVTVSLDSNLASNALSNGMRCQYNDPDFPYSSSYGDTECYLGFAAGSGSTNVNLWHVHQTLSVDGGRAYAGKQSLHYGRHSTAGLDTTDLSQMDAVRLRNALALAARICRDDPSANPRACNVDADCVAVGGPCVSASPELSFKQQISLLSGRYYRLAIDRGVVMVQPTGSTTWYKISPYWNVYDMTQTDQYSNCTFDPTDDGNDEDSYYDPGDPFHRFGPSSTCAPEFVFAYQGNTDQPYQPDNLGFAEGPGLQGAVGTGTWVESRFDLSRFRGRSIQIRFLVSTIKSNDTQSTESLFAWNPVSVDDGWFLDDVRITQTLGTVASTVALDNQPPPSALPDSDGDGVGDGCDCAPGDASAFGVPGELADLHFEDDVTLAWTPPPATGSGTLQQVVRGKILELPVGSGASETCVASGSTSSAADPTVPTVGDPFWYLVRAKNACATGPWAYRRDGSEIMDAACP